jgi:hypothetical protein
VKTCKKCVLSEPFPNLEFDDEGVCNFCRKHAEVDRNEFDALQRKNFEEVLQQQKGKYRYDALCCYSGGKDSTYMLKMMVQDMGLKVLSYTLDNGFITEQSKLNIQKLVDMLGVDHIFYRPSSKFMSKMYRESMTGDLNKGRGSYTTRISDACLSCISLVNTHAARLAIQMQIPMIFAGFTKGQIPKAVIKNQYKYYRESYAQYKDHYQERLGPDSGKYFNLEDSNFEIYQMSPYLVYNVSEAQILSEIKELGWIYPENLDGCTSNCSLNAVGNMFHEKRYGFHPYALELSQLVRAGELTREEALKKLSLGAPSAQVKSVLKQLGIPSEGLCAE